MQRQPAYRTLFGEEPPKTAAIAIMTDTDTTSGSAEAWYGEIILSTERLPFAAPR
jgi:hypothetical protein